MLVKTLRNGKLLKRNEIAYPISNAFQAVVPMASRQNEVEMFQKGHFQSIFVGTSSLRPKSEMEDTDFEEDMSDFDDYAGRRSEESVGIPQQSRSAIS